MITLCEALVGVLLRFWRRYQFCQNLLLLYQVQVPLGLVQLFWSNVICTLQAHGKRLNLYFLKGVMNTQSSLDSSSSSKVKFCEILLSWQRLKDIMDTSQWVFFAFNTCVERSVVRYLSNSAIVFGNNVAWWGHILQKFQCQPCVQVPFWMFVHWHAEQDIVKQFWVWD